MGSHERCVIWGDDPDTRQSLGAGTPGTSDRTLQGTAASAAVPFSPRCAGRAAARPSPAIVVTVAALAFMGIFEARGQGGPDAARDGLAAPPGGPQVDAAFGVAGVVFPIDTPPGRHGMQPALALRYSSAAGPGEDVFIEADAMHQLVDSTGRIVGAYGTRDLAFGFEHGAAGFYDTPQAATRPHHLYLLGGISTQQFTREIFRAGYSGTLFTLSGRASDFLIEFVYGPYGGGLALGVQAGREAAAARAGRDP